MNSYAESRMKGINHMLLTTVLLAQAKFPPGCWVWHKSVQSLQEILIEQQSRQISEAKPLMRCFITECLTCLPYTPLVPRFGCTLILVIARKRTLQLDKRARQSLTAAKGQNKSSSNMAGEGNESSSKDIYDCYDSDEKVGQKCYGIKQQKAFSELLNLLTLVNWPECARLIIIIQVMTDDYFLFKILGCEHNIILFPQ